MKERELTPEERKLFADDDQLIPNIGDEREVVQTARVTLGDGTAKTFPMTFVRTRNENGGVDCKAIVPASLNIGVKTKK